MTLNQAEHDATVELANIGISRAARQLSVLLDDEIRIQVPSATLLESPEAALAVLSHAAGGDVACVYQRLGGELSGRVALLLPSRNSLTMFHSLVGQGTPLQGLDLRAFEHEAMTEIGNIIISSCVSAMADMLRQRITVSVPRYAEASIDSLFEDEEAREIRTALVIHARLHAVRRDVEGVIMLMFSASVAGRILDAVHRIVSGAEG